MLQECAVFYVDTTLSASTGSDGALSHAHTFRGKNYLTVITIDNTDFLAELAELKNSPPEAPPMSGNDFLAWLEKE
jgi:hypothetical protein